VRTISLMSELNENENQKDFENEKITAPQRNTVFSINISTVIDFYICIHRSPLYLNEAAGICIGFDSSRARRDQSQARHELAPLIIYGSAKQ
jgi:hypothetical protein